MLPQVAQAALAIECRTDDSERRALLARIEDPSARRCVDAERDFLAELGGDCSLPAAAHATLAGGEVTVEGRLAAVDGSVVLRHVGLDGAAVARHLLYDQDGARLLGR
jgi:hydroxymethylbilane synthase